MSDVSLTPVAPVELPAALTGYTGLLPGVSVLLCEWDLEHGALLSVNHLYQIFSSLSFDLSSFWFYQPAGQVYLWKKLLLIYF